MGNLENVHYQVVKTADELQKVFFVRGIVFEEGQNCAYSADFDGLDYSSVHFLASIGSEPVAAARMRFFSDYVKIERLAVRNNYRQQGIGKELFAFVISHAKSLNYKKIIIHAQAYLLNFYQSFGFIPHGEKFLEENIEHYYMELRIES
ncbi:MAG: GNAT family N-acetyltransferase [Bacteroidales bacterium]|nr:GNAT family N-acetyltransferase [Bacteroidales bacterium]